MKKFTLYKIPILIELFCPFENSKKLTDVERNIIRRTRNANKIILDRYSTGCADDAIVFMSLARSLNITTFYVETLEKRWLERLKKEILYPIEGHIFCDVVIGNRVIPFNPRYGKTEIEDGYYIRDPKGKRVKYEVLGKGLDFTQVYLKMNENFETKPTSLQTIEKLKKAIIKRYIKNP